MTRRRPRRAGARTGPGPRRVRASRRRRDLARAARSRSGPRPAARSTCSSSRTATAGSSDPARDRAELARDPAGRDRGRRPRCSASRACGSSGSTTASCENTPTVREAVVRRIREVRAETVVSRRPDRGVLREPLLQPQDHRTAGEIALDSAFPGVGQPALLLRAPGGGARRPGGAPTSGSAGRTSRTTSRTSPATSRRRSPRSPSTRASSPRGSRSSRSSSTKDAVELGAKIGGTHAEEFRVLDLS